MPGESERPEPRKSNATVATPRDSSQAIVGSQPQRSAGGDSCASTTVVEPFPANAV